MSIEENKSYEMSTEEKKCYEVSSEEKKSYQMPTEERKSYEMVVEKKKWYEMPLVATVKPLEKNIQTNMSSSTMGTVKKLAMNYAKNLQDKNKSSSDLVATVLETTAVLRPSRQSKNQNRPWSMYTTATETVDAEPKHYTDDLTEDLLNNNETIRKYSTLTKSNKTEQQDKFDSHIYSIPNKKPSSYQSNLGDFGEYSKAYQKPPIQKQPQQSNNIRSLAQSFENQNNHNVRKSLNNIALSNSSSTRNLHIAQPNIVVTRFSDNINSTFNKSVPSRKIGMVVGAATPPTKRIQKGWLESEGL
uniref:Uncharacterized protein n=1 Tax=Rhabditophanes sp. KR3021 TaxID=114890 RepID=A0AC35TR69_9BILA